MKENRTVSDKQLSTLLREWRVEAPVPLRFQEQVWRHIERAQAEYGLTIWLGIRRFIDVLLPRPKVALVYITVLAIIGVAAGLTVGQIRGQRLNRALSEQYVQSIDPYRSAGRTP